MADLTPQRLRALQTSFSLIYSGAYSETPVFWDKLATRVPSTSRQNDYGWMNELENMREWLGERLVRNLSASNYQLVNKEYELTVGIKAIDIKDDNLGVYGMRFQHMGKSVRKHPDQLIFNLMQSGQTLECFDGQFFFDGDHPVNRYDASQGTYQNYWASGRALDATNFEYLRAQGMAFKGESGRSLGLVHDLLVVPPQLEQQAKRIVMADKDQYGATNVNQGAARILVVPELANQPATWYLLCTSQAVMPFVYQVREEPSFQSFTSMQDEHVFKCNEFLFGASCRDNVGFTLPFLALKAAALHG